MPIPAKERIIPSDDGTKHIFVRHADNFLPQVTNEDRVQHGQHITKTAALMLDENMFGPIIHGDDAFLGRNGLEGTF